MSRVSPKESAARKAVDNLLSHLGWAADEYSEDCDVFTERAKTQEQNKRLKGFEPDYLLYENGSDRILAVIEAKRPGGSLEGVIDDAIKKYAKPLGINIIFATDGTLFQTFDRRAGGPLLLDGEPVVDLLSPKLTLKFAKEGPSLVTPTRVRQTKSELMSIFSQANTLLRKEGLRAGIERFSEFSNLLFLKLISEIENDREESGSPRRLEQRYCWDAFSTKPADEM